jgi:hypothetical protein
MINCLRISFMSSIKTPLTNTSVRTAALVEVTLISYKDKALRSIVVKDLLRSLKKSGIVPTVLATTFILFYISVPVLFKYIFVTLSIISQALSCWTRLLSLSILLNANANVSITVRGRPFRTAITSTVREMIRIFKKSCPFCVSECKLCKSCTKNLINSTTNKNRAATLLKQAIALASLLSLNCKGVKLGSTFKDIRILL